ncbi:hypothetical protein [Macromonas nakdongensis]|uniref:hypothetical protein n=1 Tax=Macromonas nakdongensis TaxID=1843082 RepID=UPI0012FEE9B8|nr:hypothetical protein [Macromonas nakdongensis]
MTQANRHIGRFTAPAEWARCFKTELKRVMGQCIVVRAKHLLVSDVIEYWAVCPHFRAIAEGEIAPKYRWVFTADGDMWPEEETGL